MYFPADPSPCVLRGELESMGVRKDGRLAWVREQSHLT